jgi:hypothetical protein
MTKFLREVFSEEGQGSFSRVASGLHVVAGLAWVSHFVWHTHVLPDAATMAGLSAFVVAPYGANKFANAFGARGGNQGASQ